MQFDVTIRKIFVSDGHRFAGRHGQEPEEFEMVEKESIEVVAGRGILGDRYFDHKPNYKGQLTFFSEEAYLKLREQFPGVDRDPSVFRRNVMVSGVDLNALIGKSFDLGGVSMVGVEEAAPCYWMNRAYCEGAHEALKGMGGLRVRIETDGELRLGPASLQVAE